MHENYERSIDKILNIYLKAKFGLDAVKQFYERFASEFKAYELEDYETTQIILEMVDASRFSAEMIVRKRVRYQGSDEYSEQLKGAFESQTEMEQLFWQLHNSSNNSWRKHTDFENTAIGVVKGSVYGKKVGDYPIDFDKSAMIMKNM